MTDREIDRIIEMAWEDRTPFEAIKNQFGVSGSEVAEIVKVSRLLESPILFYENCLGPLQIL